MNEKQPKISVIVPVYKAEVYLHRCVDSILAQTFQDFEVLLVDDGSPDRSGEICDEYARKDQRVRVFHKENGGVSSARNLGLDNAKGEWATFVDSDDYVENSYLSDFGLEKCGADFYLQGYRKILSKEKSRLSHFSVKQVQIVSFSDAYYEGEDKVIINFILGKLIRLAIVKRFSLAFDVTLSFGEDHLFFLSYLTHVQKIALSPATSYNYVCYGNGSLSTRVVPLKDLLYYAEQTYKLQMRIMQDHEEGRVSIVKAIQKRTYINIISTIRNFFLNKDKNLYSYSTVKQFYKSLKCGYDGICFRQKCLMYLFLNLPSCCSYLIFATYAHVRLH